jgi:hypothetical protein
VNQKPPAGAQHPNGDVLNVADMFFRTASTGGEAHLVVGNLWSRTVPMTLAAGSNSIAILQRPSQRGHRRLGLGT